MLSNAACREGVHIYGGQYSRMLRTDESDASGVSGSVVSGSGENKAVGVLLVPRLVL